MDIFITLKKVPLFSYLSATDISDIIEGASVERYPKRSCLMVEGEPGNEMFVLLSGKVSVTATTDDGQPLTLATLKPGQYFGEQALLPSNNGIRTASTHCITPVEVLNIPKPVFLLVLNRSDKFSLALKEMGAKQLRHRMAQETALFRSVQLTPDSEGWLTEKRFSAGEVVFEQGDKADCFYLVISGVAKVTRKKSGSEKVQHYIGVGGYFGEQALINDIPRPVSVKAKSHLTTLVLQGESFKSLYRGSKSLQMQLTNLSTIYQLPNRGLITMHASTLMGKKATTAIFHNADGPQLTFSRVVGESLFSVTKPNLKSVKSATIFRYDDELDGVQREMTVSGRRILSVTCAGSWLDLAYVLNLMFKDRLLKRRQLALFRQEGDLRLERNEFGAEDDTIVCQCASISRGCLKKCINSGFNSVQDLSDETGAGKVCGSCIPIMTDMIGRTDHTLVTFIGSTAHSNDTRSFRFHPTHKDLAPANPAQHIVLEAQIDGQWQKRSYTLTSAMNSTQSYEIMVKKEPNGVVSTWLHDEMDSHDLLRVGKPKGGYDFSYKLSIPFVFFVAGVGITPLIGYLRSIDKMDNGEINRSVTANISVKSNEDGVCLSELSAYAEQRRNFNLSIRYTATEGRVTEKAVKETCTANPGAIYFICGPNAYQQRVSQTLNNQGVSDKQIQIESFTHRVEKAEKVDGVVIAALPNAIQAKSKGPSHGVTYSLSIIAIVAVVWLAMTPTVDLLSSVKSELLGYYLLTDKIMHQVTGYVILGVIAIGMLFSLRKRMKGVSFGRFSGWRLIHLMGGVIAVSGLYFHTGWSVGNNHNFYLMSLFLLLAVFGSISMMIKLRAEKTLSKALVVSHERMRRWHIGLSLFFPAFLFGHIITGYYF